MPTSPGSSATRWIAIAQLLTVIVGTAILVGMWRRSHDPWIVALFVCAAIVGGLTILGVRSRIVAERAASALARTVVEERQLSATLERNVADRTSELEDAQRVLQRMWWLGQQITLELNPQRVLDRFLEAVVDIVQGDGAVMGLLDDDGQVRVVIGTGSGNVLSGATVPLSDSAMGRVIRTGTAWVQPDLLSAPDQVNADLLVRIQDTVASLAIVPISRRGERIGAVTVFSRVRRDFTPGDLERIEAMGDLLSVSLENAELVETLRQAEWRFRTLFRAAPDAVFTVLQSGRIREANDAVREMTGADPLQVVGRLVGDLVAEPDREKLERALAATFAGTPARIEVSFQHEARGATAKRVVALAMVRLPEADPPSVLLVGRDMTSERDMRMRLMESDRLAAVGELVAGVAHEVNNPLSSISAFAQLLLRDGGLSAQQRDSIEVIKAETLRASQVVRDLLAFARRSETMREPVDMNSVIGRTLRLRGYQLSSNRIELQTDFAQELPSVVGDARQLQQVCLNLVTNAIQAMEAAGEGTLSVSTRGEGTKVVLEMRDTGRGIPESAQAHIFEPFFTTKGEGEGTGLGLSVSYGIITAHGGTIEVANTSAAGTTFRVSLPAVNEQADDLARGDAPGIVLRSPLAGIRLLFIDDEPALRAGLQAFGRLRGFTVVVAENGIQGLEALRETQVDAVVCDLRMSGMDGPAFHERLRGERPGLAARTVFITGDVVTAGSRAGVKQPVLAKPFTFDKLEETLVAVMRGAPVATLAGWP
jgi:two-component system NtrC family sensor kinase